MPIHLGPPGLLSEAASSADPIGWIGPPGRGTEPPPTEVGDGGRIPDRGTRLGRRTSGL